MCRIVGMIDHSVSQIDLQQNVLKMRDVMLHGGPDGSGFWAENSMAIALGHRRLSLLDLSEAGHQPMINQEKNLVICFNGEIYNFKELRNELKTKGFKFITETDTEVILAAYKAYGIAAFAKFNGMFAFALVDLIEQKMYLVRDSAGIKPMYYSIHNNKLIFASEIKAFKSLNDNFTEQPIWRTLFLAFGHIPEPYTTLKEVTILPKGTFISFDLKSKIVLASKAVPFYQNKFTEKITDYQTSVKLVRETFIKAVESHLFADAPVGIFMSGGIDSSLIALIADKILQKENNHTLSVVFKESKYSERKYQEIVASRLRNKHQYFEVGKADFYDSFGDIKKAADQPSIDGINTYFISMFAKQMGLKAVLSGLGADELFGGYSTFQRAKYLPYAQKGIPKVVFKIFATIAKDKYKKIGYLGLNDQIGVYLFFRGLFTPDVIAKLLNISEQEVYETLKKVYLGDSINELSLGNKISWQEFNLYMQNQLLKDSDIMSMWHSLELRTPFLDKDFVALAHSIDAQTKFYSTKRSKELLLAAFEDILPMEIWKRQKQGFVFPFQEWLQQHPNLLFTENNKMALEMKKEFQQGKLHWSRIWAMMQVL